MSPGSTCFLLEGAGILGAASTRNKIEYESTRLVNAQHRLKKYTRKLMSTPRKPRPVPPAAPTAPVAPKDSDYMGRDQALSRLGIKRSTLLRWALLDGK